MSTAKRAVAKLKALGHVDFEENSGGRNHRNDYFFDLTVSPVTPFDDGNGVTPDTLSDHKPCQQRRETVSPVTGNGVTSDTRKYPGESPSEKHPVKKRESAARSTLISAHAKISPIQLEIAAEQKIDKATAKEQFTRFKNYHQSKGSKFADWDSAWRTWCIRHVDYQNEHNPEAGKKRYYRRDGQVYDRQDRSISGSPLPVYGGCIPESEIEDFDEFPFNN